MDIAEEATDLYVKTEFFEQDQLFTDRLRSLFKAVIKKTGKNNSKDIADYLLKCVNLTALSTNIYVLACPLWGNNIYKIGKADNIEKRIGSINTSLTKDAYLVHSRVVSCGKSEGEIHEKLKTHRMSSKKEFFNCDLHIIKKVVDSVVANYNTVKHPKFVHNRLVSIINNKFYGISESDSESESDSDTLQTDSTFEPSSDDDKQGSKKNPIVID